jgi:hypothetical protein
VPAILYKAARKQIPTRINSYGSSIVILLVPRKYTILLSRKKNGDDGSPKVATNPSRRRKGGISHAVYLHQHGFQPKDLNLDMTQFPELHIHFDRYMASKTCAEAAMWELYE